MRNKGVEKAKVVTYVKTFGGERKERGCILREPWAGRTF